MSLSTAERLLLERRLRRLHDRSTTAFSAGGLLAAALFLTPVALLAAGGVAAGVTYTALADELAQGVANIQNLHRRQMFQTTRIYDRNGILLREVFVEGRRTYIPLHEIPATLRQATIAVEDDTFYTNPGVDVAGVLRAAGGELMGTTSLGGGSTITQQFVRHVAFSYEERVSRSYTRKLKEIVLALILARQQSKDQVLEWYLNEIYYGNLSYGIEAAAQTVFGKSARDLDLAESALLAALPQSPVHLDPLSTDPAVQQAVRARQRLVLDLMVQRHMVSRALADAAAAQELVFHERDDGLFLAPHFVVYVEKVLEERLGAERLARGGLEVTTTLDLSLQQFGEKVVREHVERLRDRHDLSNAALVAMQPRTGQVLAMVGSADYWNEAIDGEVNVTVRERQPGSSIKPITYVTALEQGLPASSLLWDVPMELYIPEKFEPENYDGVFHGPVRLRAALANSYNIPAMKLLATIPPVTHEDGDLFDAYMSDLAVNYPGGLFPEGHPHAGERVQVLVGWDQTVATAHRLGITGLNRPPDAYGLSLTLGGGEVTLLDMTTAYSTLANGGGLVRPNPILRIADPSGTVLYDLTADAAALEPQPAVDPRAAFIVTDILSDNEARTPAFGASSPLRIGAPAAVKTGTTNDYRDNWTIGYTPYLTVGVWAGNNDNRPMRNTSGVTGAAPIWNTFTRNVAVDPETRALVEASLAPFDLPFRTGFEKPAGLVQAEVCRLASLNRIAAGCLEYETELFIEGTEPAAPGSVVPPEGAAGPPVVDETAGGAPDVWTIVNAVVVPLPPPPPELVAAAAAEDRPVPWPPAVLCQDMGTGEKVQPVAVLPLPVDEPVSQIGEERRMVLEWARENGWAALEPTEPCTAEMVNAALASGSLPGFAPGMAPGQVLTPTVRAEYRLNLAAESVVRTRTVLTGTVRYNPAEIEYYKVELGRGRQPREWITLGDVHRDQIVDGPLEVLDAPSLPAGDYVVRLVLVKTDGNFVQPPHQALIRIEP